VVEDHGTQGTQFTQNYEFFLKIESTAKNRNWSVSKGKKNVSQCQSSIFLCLIVLITFREGSEHTQAQGNKFTENYLIKFQ
jgi:hypothetical protein